MSSLKNLARLIDGLSLVAKEIVRRSETADSARTGDLQTLISSSLKKVIVTATDFSGLTKGSVHDLSRPRPKESVVYFDHSLNPAAEEGVPAAERDPGGGGVNFGQLNAEAKVAESVNVLKSLQGDGLATELEDKGSAGGGRDSAEAVAKVTAAPVKKRKPRERKVPSTPFSRAFG